MVKNATMQGLTPPGRARREAVRRVLEGRNCRPEHESAEAFAPSNIALVKYWGKRDEALHLPVTGSLSVSMGRRGTFTRVRAAEHDRVMFNGETLPQGDARAERLARFLDLFRSPEVPAFFVETANTIPTGAGLASSASGFAALVLALDTWFGWKLPRRALSILARLGSGSASRSVYEGFVEWHAGCEPDGSDSFAEQISATWPGLCISAVVVEPGPKPISSGEAMRKTVATSPLYASWPGVVDRDLYEVRAAIEHRDVERLGCAAEGNAMAMHATMHAARPSICYWKPATLDGLAQVRALRSEGHAVYVTMDAGPNLKLIHDASATAACMARFPSLDTVWPFG